MQELTEKAGIIVLASHNHQLLKRTCNKAIEPEGGHETIRVGRRGFRELKPGFGTTLPARLSTFNRVKQPLQVADLARAMSVCAGRQFWNRSYDVVRVDVDKPRWTTEARV